MDEIVGGIDEIWKIGAVLSSIIGTLYFIRYQIKKGYDLSCNNRTKIEHVEQELDVVKKEAQEIRRDYVQEIHRLEKEIIERFGKVREDLHNAHKEQLTLIGQLMRTDANNTKL